MARLSRKPIKLSAGVLARREDGVIVLSGSLGEKRVPLLPMVAVREEDHTLIVSSTSETRQAIMNQGTMWSLLHNAAQGVSRGFSKTLEIQGIGYRASLEGKTLVLSLGYVHPIRYEPPPGVGITVEKNMVRISGVDKERVGQAAAEIRALKKPEPYKGKGIRYEGEAVKRKTGKKAAVAGAGPAAA